MVHPAPERPSLLTRHIISLSEVAQRDRIDSRSQLIPGETGLRKASSLAEDPDLARVSRGLLLRADDEVSVLARCRLMKERSETQWNMVAIEQCFISSTLVPNILNMTRTWFDASRAVLMGGSCGVQLV